MTTPQLPGIRVRERRAGSTWEVRVDRVHDLQALAVVSVAVAAPSRLDVTVARWRPPVAGWIGRPGIRGIASLSVEPERSGVRVSMVMTEPTDAALLVSAAVRVLRPVAGESGPELTFAPGLPTAAASVGGQIRDVLLADEERDRHVRRCDVLLVPDVDTAALPDRAVTVHLSSNTWTRDGVVSDVSVDPSVHRPVGRRSTAGTAIAEATVEAGAVRLDLAGTRIYLGSRITAASVGALREVGAAVGEGLPATIVRQLSACGVLVLASAADAPAPDDHLEWQARSVHERRHALRQYGPTAALDAWPTVSAVLVTHRPDHVAHAMSQLAGLRYPRLQVVIGVHGDRVDAALVAELARTVPYPVTVVPVDASLNLGQALATCFARADGELLTKVDDDDVYGPEHIWDLVLARQYSGAQVVGKALDWVYLESQDATVFRPVYGAEKYADFVAGGTMLISRADLASVGGWRPVPKSVDRALLDRVLADGGLVYRTHGLGYVYVRHSSGHTASVADEHFLTKTTGTITGLVRHDAFGTAAHG